MLRKSYLLGLTITLLIIPLMLIDPDIFKLVELKLLDFRFVFRGQSQHSRDIVIVSIDDKSISRIGRWPWSREKYAVLIDKVKQAGAKVIAFDIYFQEAGGGVLSREDKMLIESIRKAGNVVAPLYFNFNKRERSREEAEIEDIGLLAIEAIENRDSLGEYPMVKGYELFASFPELNRAASGMGHINMIADKDGIVRKEVMVVDYKNRYIPSLGLKVAQEYLGVGNESMTLVGGEGIALGDKKILISPEEISHAMLWGLVHINYRGGYKTFDYVSFVDVINDRFPMDTFRDKVVLVGATAAGLYDLRSTPFATVFPGIEKQANVVDNIIHGDFITKPFQSDVLSAILCVFIGVSLTFLIPRVKLLHTIIIVCVLTTVIILGAYIAFVKANSWINMTYPMVTTWFVFLASVLALSASAKRDQHKALEESHEAIKMLGLSYQDKGSLELAYDSFKKLPLNDEVMTLLYHLAVQLEKKRKDSLAIEIYKKICIRDENFEDVAERLSTLGVRTVEPTEGAISIRQGQTLGRYEIVKQLGKGAMGEVYLAKDPHVDRYVAIKTFRFGREIDEESLRKIKENLLREARMAGKLSHPNIVTIYDAGEDWDLSYIAMEVLEGVELTNYCKPENLLPYERVIEIVSCVARALDYAHDQGVIHRDIKPANIMIQKGGGIKITDFGIACVNDRNVDRVELVGTPVYMSPEQVGRSELDGRTDLYSLGVVLFELLTGRKPFTAPSLGELMKTIVNDPAPPLREMREGVPEYFQVIINKLLEKDKEKRYSRGGDLVYDIKKTTVDSNASPVSASTLEYEGTIHLDLDKD
jgi:serine/threonine-protein kinase